MKAIAVSLLLSLLLAGCASSGPNANSIRAGSPPGFAGDNERLPSYDFKRRPLIACRVNRSTVLEVCKTLLARPRLHETA